MGLPSFITTDIEKWLSSFSFFTTIRPRFSETDAFGHVNNISYFTYFEQARLDYFANLGLIEPLLNSLEKSMVVTANLECHYLAQLFYGQTIEVYVRTAKIGRSSFELEYAIVEKDEKSIVAVGRGTIVHINKTTNGSEELPDFVRSAIREFENYPLLG